MYAIQVGNRWFDADTETPNCIGRFANQKNVLESLKRAQEMSRKSRYPEINEADWIGVNKEAEAAANVRYKRDRDQLVLVAGKDLPKSKGSEELFAFYGDVRVYWLAAVTAHPDQFPVEMVEIVNWFTSSEECNWTTEQKAQWLGLN